MNKFFTILISIIILAVISNCTNENTPRSSETIENTPGKISFHSSDTLLVNSFNWAKQKALSFAHDEGDSVGKWYEAALPKREAFCMRDVSHHATGAAALGLQNYTLNMMRKFAENISESKDYCSFWEINKYNKPAPVDYRNDKEFWYNLPANYDVIDACYRQYLWTGEKAYINDSVFLSFYKQSIYNYTQRWKLEIDEVLTRERFLNVPDSMDEKDAFHVCRGLPTYGEADWFNVVLGGDLLGAQYAAYKVYSAIMKLNNNDEEAEIMLKKAENIKTLFNDHFWNEKENTYNVMLYKDGTYKSGTEDFFQVYFDITREGERTEATVEKMIARLTNVESKSYFPEILYRFNENKESRDILLKLTHETTKRRDYPEVSFSVIGAMVNGMMGIQPDATKSQVTTISRLTEETKWAEIRNVPVLTNEIQVKHVGLKETIFTNISGDSIVWKACFIGGHNVLMVNGKKKKAKEEVRLGQLYSCVNVTVDEGDMVSVSVK